MGAEGEGRTQQLGVDDNAVEDGSLCSGLLADGLDPLALQQQLLYRGLVLQLQEVLL